MYLSVLVNNIGVKDTDDSSVENRLLARLAQSPRWSMIIYPTDEKLADEFNVNPAEFKKQVKALSKAAKKLSDMGF